jgi:hypothetical protein
MGLKLIYYYAIIIVVLTTAFLVGYLFHSVVKPSKKNPATLFSVFANAVIGLVILVSIYSIIITSGKTVSWIYILLLLGYGYFLKSNSTTDNTPVLSGHYLKAGLSLSLVSVFFYFLYLSSLLDFKTLRFTDTFCDWQFYSKISQYLNLGFESTTQFDNIAFGATFTPYHYFEIWIAAAISRVFEVPSQVATSIIMPSVLGCVSFVGVLGFARQINNRNAVLAFLLLFISCISFFSSFLCRIGVVIPPEVGNILSVVANSKLYPIFIFFVFFFHYGIRSNLFLALICLLFIPIASFVAAPTIIPLVWLIVIYHIVVNKHRRLCIRFIYFLALYSLIFGCYYVFFWDKLTINTFVSFSNIGAQLSSFKNFLLVLLFFSPFLFFSLYFSRNTNLDFEFKVLILICYSILLILELVVVYSTATYYDGIQFSTVVFIPSAASLVVFVIFRTNVPNSNLLKLSVIVFVTLLCSSVFFSIRYLYSQSKSKEERTFINGVVRFTNVENKEMVSCGFIHSENYYSRQYMSSISKVFRVGEILDTYKGCFLQVGLSDYVALACFQNQQVDDLVSRSFGLSRISEGTFYKFVELQKKMGEFKSVESSQLNFIDQFNIDYIFIQNDASISPQLFGRIVLLAAENSKVGYSFYKITR